MDSKAIWNRLTSMITEFSLFEASSAQAILSSSDPASQMEVPTIRIAIAQEIAGAFIRLAKRTPSELRYYRKAIARQLGVSDFHDWLEKILAADGLPDESIYCVAKDYSCACIYAGEYDTALRIWRLALTNSREPPVAQLEAIDANAAGAYDKTELHQNMNRNFMAFLRPHLVQRNDFLDLCCGTGLTTAHLELDDKRIVGVDLEFGGLHAAHRSSLFSSVHEGDAHAILPTLASASFEAVWCCGALYFFADPNWIFVESSRLLRASGLLCLNTWPSPEEHDVSITRGGTFRYCHSHGYLTRSAEKAGLRLIEKNWKVGYNMPTWHLLFEKIS